MRLQHFELLLVRLLHLLAHHPDFSPEVDDLKTFARYEDISPQQLLEALTRQLTTASVDCFRYIEFFLDCVLTKENVALLYYLALKCKTVRDSKSAEFDTVRCSFLASEGQNYCILYSFLTAITSSLQNLYTLSELAQYVIKSRCAMLEWLVEKYPGQIRMPSDIFKALPSPEVALKVSHIIRDWESDPTTRRVE